MYSTALNEAILDAWLQLTAIVNNDRLVSDLTLNESLVIRLLNQADQPLSASELCQRMTMKKSQMSRSLAMAASSVSPASFHPRTGTALIFTRSPASRASFITRSTLSSSPPRVMRR